MCWFSWCNCQRCGPINIHNPTDLFSFKLYTDTPIYVYSNPYIHTHSHIYASVHILQHYKHNQYNGNISTYVNFLNINFHYDIEYIIIIHNMNIFLFAFLSLCKIAKSTRSVIIHNKYILLKKYMKFITIVLIILRIIVVFFSKFTLKSRY